MDFEFTTLIEPIGKWFHIIAGIMWIGLLYFFNFINGHVAATYNADSKKSVVPELMPRTLYWFRWGAAWTWFTGILLMVWIFWMNEGIVFDGEAVEAKEAIASGEDLLGDEEAIADRLVPYRHLAFILPFIMVFVYDYFYKCNCIKNVRISTLISYFSILGVFLLLHCVFGVLEYRALNIHIGAMFGSMMAFNVWFRIWPAQQQIISAIKNGDAPDADLAATAGLRSKHNTYLSVPLIWTMISVHSTHLSGSFDKLISKVCGCESTSAIVKYDWILLMLVVALGWHLVFQLYKKSGKIKGF